MTTQPTAGPLVLRFLALVLTALYRRGYQHVAEPVVEGAGKVVVHLHVNAKLTRQVEQLVVVVTEALAEAGVVAIPSPLRATVFDVSASPEALQKAPSPEALGAVLQCVLRKRMAREGYPEADGMRVQGISVGEGVEAIYVTGGADDREGAANAKAVAWCRAWLAKHFAEFAVEEGRDPVSKLAVWHVDGNTVRRALRITVAGAATATRAA